MTVSVRLRRLFRLATVAGLLGGGIALTADVARAGIFYVPENRRILNDWIRFEDLPAAPLLAVDIRFGGWGGCGGGECIEYFAVVDWAGLGGAFIAGKGEFAAALPAGAEIGPGLSWWSPTVEIATAYSDYFPPGCGDDPDACETEPGFSEGPWANAGTRYLGLKVLSEDGLVYYGWAGLNVAVDVNLERMIRPTLTGYALNLEPDQPIRAGQTTIPEPGTLGLLSLGVLAGVAVRRRRC